MIGLLAQSIKPVQLLPKYERSLRSNPAHERQTRYLVVIQ
ncbi:hypothetical protein N790_01400 [Arenimonas malthae CC-JY-1]|uniref:Uncharacterized protein n=1 Tax=Arenimonas malthae CC-JY-1 TaxID=1384054 RepID=A0A091BAJ6_9GAMM|nr:hypothetical protein N790_01400 [Arenimonas malthae CC-JY-1]